MSRLRNPLGAWTTLPADCLPVNFAPHAIERYGERMRPGLELDAVQRELSRLLQGAVVTRKRPEWIATDQTPTAWLLLGDDVCLPLWANGGELVAATALSKNMVEGQRRENRNAASQKRRAGRRTARRSARHMPRPDRSGPSLEDWRD